MPPPPPPIPLNGSHDPTVTPVVAIPGQRAAAFLAAAQWYNGGRPRAPFAETWGANDYGQLGDGGSPTARGGNGHVTVEQLSSVVTAVAGGQSHCLAVRNGAAYAWGRNDYGQLGSRSTGRRRLTPTIVRGLAAKVTAVAAGDSHSLALCKGAVYAWGRNDRGQLGNDTTTDSAAPVPVMGLGDSVTAIAAGGSFSLALRNGAVYSWGSNTFGELGNISLAHSRTPEAVIGLGEGVTAIAAGDHHGVAIKQGAAYTWGSNSWGQLGSGTKLKSLLAAKVSGLTDGVTAVAAGSSHCLVVRHGTVYAFGKGLGPPCLTPVEVDPAKLQNIIAVAAGDDSSYALAADGSLWVWGSNRSGALGLGPGSGTSSLKPARLLPPDGCVYQAISVGCRASHMIAIVAPAPLLSCVDLKIYLPLRDELQTLGLPALQAIAADPQQPGIKRGVAAYYVFLQTLAAGVSAAEAKRAISALDDVTNTFMDPCSYVKLAALYADDYPEFGVLRNLVRALKYLSISWELGELVTEATGDNALLTLILSNNLGLGDAIFGSQTSSLSELKQILDLIRPEVLEARERFRLLYHLSFPDKCPGTTAVERHYSR